MLHKNVYLQSLAYELPSQVVTTNSICERLTPTFQRLGIPSSWVCALSGVNERRVWGEGESLADIAARIARKVVEDSGIPLERIGCVVCTSVSKEFIEPSMACMVHSALGLPETTSSYDISNACLAFLNLAILWPTFLCLAFCLLHIFCRFLCLLFQQNIMFHNQVLGHCPFGFHSQQILQFCFSRRL